MNYRVIKRNGNEVDFDIHKIEIALQKALYATSEVDINDIDEVAARIANTVFYILASRSNIFPIEDIQDEVEKALMFSGYAETAKSYIMYRAERDRIRQSDSALMDALGTIINTKSTEDDEKRSNANIDGDTSMGAMLQIGATASKEYYLTHLISKEQAQAHRDGYIHIHDLDFYGLTTTCTQIDLLKLFHDGFSTGHGHLREPNSIGSYAALAAIAIQSNQNDQHGGQGVPNFDYAMAEGVAKSYRKNFKAHLKELLEITSGDEIDGDIFDKAIAPIMDSVRLSSMTISEQKKLLSICSATFHVVGHTDLIQAVERRAHRDTDKQTYQAMEGFVHNLNTMHSRAGAQVPFSSINYGTDTTEEGRMAIRNVLLALDAGLGNGETAIFPIHIFKVKEGVNYNPADPNYDLFKLSMKVSAKRLFPNYVFEDSPFNKQYYVEGHPETEVATMGCRTRVIANRCGPETTYGRGNLSFTSINLPRLAIESQGEIDIFFTKLKDMLEMAKKQLLDRFEIQAKRKVYNYPFLMGQGVWMDADKLKPTDDVREVIKHGTLSIGFIGLAETLTSLYGKHHGESEEMQAKGLEIIQFMRDYCDKAAEETGLNFSLLATPAESLSGRFVKIDRARYGEIPGVTDKTYYTNSFHIPVGFKISLYDKIAKEAPYHALTNAGHITYVEVDGDIANNISAFESIIRCMHDSNIGYGSINHPVDRDPVCGYVGIIGDTCPRCGRRAGKGVSVKKLNELRKKYPNMPHFYGAE